MEMATDFDHKVRVMSLTAKRSDSVTAIEEEPLSRVEEKQAHIVTQLITKVTEDDRDNSRQQTEESQDIAQQQPLSQRSTWPISPAGIKVRYYAFDHIPTLTSTPWEANRHKRLSFSHPRRRLGGRQLPAHVFEELPYEIYSCILGHLEATYSTCSVVDNSGRKQALRTLCLTSKRWAKVAIEHLYRDLVLPSSTTSSLSQKRTRRFSVMRPKSQLELLLRTLNEAPSLAFLIQRIRASTPLNKELAGENISSSQCRSAHRLLRNVIGTCTEVELVSGYSPPATKEHSEWFGLLFSCERLRAHAWTLDLDQTPIYNLGRFADLHDNWQCLETLVLCKTNLSTTAMGPGIIATIANRLSSLENLMISNFSKEDFHNGTLLSLKPLRSLRLENLDGITDQGLKQLADSPNALPLESLSLINLELASLQTLQKLLSNLTRLARLRFVQNTSPTLPVGASHTSKHSRLSSPSLKHLHWDTLIPGAAASALAASIAAPTSLPNLRSLKIPSDPTGDLQALCRPIKRVSLTTSDIAFLQQINPDACVRSLRFSRLQAQLRVRESRRRPSVSVVVSDELERTRSRQVIGSFLGDVTSGVEYVLEPDVEGDGNEALASLRDVERTGAFERLF